MCPIYQYECSVCNQTKDVIQKISELDTINVTCEQCGTEEMRRVIFAPFLEFRGGGWTEKQKKEWHNT